AISLAAGAVEVLEHAKVFATTAEALADIEMAMAATARRRELEIPVMGTGDAGNIVRGWQRAGKRSAILFGPEKAGLTNEDVVLCDMILTYPINPAFQSLNLAQAVAVFSHIWAASETAEPPELFQKDIGTPAKREDLLRLFEHMEDELHMAGYFHPPEKTPLMKRNIRAPFIRARMTAQEVQTFRGLIKALVKGRGQARR
ncbi:MAG TPA: RNA methyltransferase, partial [Hellea balneolensis]|nr:RNA methyltransferase [Hellea balneolensis]